jgi:multimeric flavodoxin WrbA
VKVVAFSGSARRNGNTVALIRHVFAPLEAAGHECELIELAGKRVHGCTACGKCSEVGDGNCQGVKDFISEGCIPKALAADAIIIGSPVYFADISTETKALIDRMGYAGRGHYARKVGAGLVAVRRGGAIHALDSIQHLFQYSGMVMIGSTYWNIGIGREPGMVEEDAEGVRTMENLGANMAWLLEKLHG